MDIKKGQVYRSAKTIAEFKVVKCGPKNVTLSFLSGPETIVSTGLFIDMIDEGLYILAEDVK